jgi:hypothetical protein
MSEQMTFADGKYTVINDNGKLTALRNGEPWDRDLIGDNLVYWMLVDNIALRDALDRLVELTAPICEGSYGDDVDKAYERARGIAK